MNRLKVILFVIMTFSGLATAVILPILAPLIRELNLTESQGGWMVSLGSIFMALLGAFWGNLSDRLGRKAVLLIGFIGLSLSYIVYTSVIATGFNGQLSGLWLFICLMLGRAMVGAFLPAVTAAAQALMADTTPPEHRSSGMAIISAAAGVGLVVGPAVGGILALYGLIWPLVLTIFTCAIGAVLVYLFIPQTEITRKRHKAPPLNPLHQGLWRWLLAGMVNMFSIVAVQISAGFYFQDSLNLTTAQTGPMLAIALTVVGLALIATQIVQVRFLKLPSRTMILIGAPLWILGMLILIHTASAPTYYLAYGLFGIGSGLAMPGFISGASLAAGDAHQGAVAGLTTTAQGVGAIIAPLLSASLYELLPVLPLWLVIGLNAVVFVTIGLEKKVTTYMRIS